MIVGPCRPLVVSLVATMVSGWGCGTEAATEEGSSCREVSTAYAGASESCIRLCDTKLGLGCTADHCGCYDCDWGAPLIAWCEDVVRELLVCQAALPASSFQCVEGSATAIAGTCQAEQDAVAICWCEGPPAGLPDPEQLCEEYCKAQQGLPCREADCEPRCLQQASPTTPEGVTAGAPYLGFIDCVRRSGELSCTAHGGLSAGRCGEIGDVILFCNTAYAGHAGGRP